MSPRQLYAVIFAALLTITLASACGDDLDQRPAGSESCEEDQECDLSPGSDYEQQDEASLSCVEGDEISGCDGVFGAPGRPGGPQGLDLAFRNYGEHPARITLVELMDAPPEIAFYNAAVVNADRYSEDPWELDDAGHRLSPTGSDIELPHNRVFAVGVIYTPNRDATLECLESHNGSCGTLRLHTKNAGVRGDIIEIPLKPHNTSEQIVIGPTEISFPADVVADRTYVADDQVVITNTGAANINIVDFYFEPRIPGLEAEAVGFPNLSAIPLSPNNSVTFSIKWTPAEDNASVNASFVVETSATDGTRRVHVTNDGENQPEIAILDSAQEALDEIVFGPLGDDGSSEVSFNIENRGASNLSWGAHFASVQPSSASRALGLRDSFGPLEVNPDPIQPGNGIGLSAIYTPDPADADTAVTATLRITSNDGSRPTISIPVYAGPAR